MSLCVLIPTTHKFTYMELSFKESYSFNLFDFSHFYLYLLYQLDNSQAINYLHVPLWSQVRPLILSFAFAFQGFWMGWELFPGKSLHLNYLLSPIIYLATSNLCPQNFHNPWLTVFFWCFSFVPGGHCGPHTEGKSCHLARIGELC